MTIVVHLFGAEAAAVGQDRICVELADAAPTCGVLRTRLVASTPALAAALRGARFAVNHAFAPDAHPIAPGDEVALIGMVSGG